MAYVSSGPTFGTAPSGGLHERSLLSQHSVGLSRGMLPSKLLRLLVGKFTSFQGSPPGVPQPLPGVPIQKVLTWGAYSYITRNIVPGVAI